MNKITLDTFIQKYNLGGNVNSVKWESSGDTMSTRFISPDKSLLGELTLIKQTLPEFEVGVYDTPLLSKMLGTLADKIDFTLTKVDNTPVAFHFTDSVMSADYVLAAIGVIPDVPELKNVPEFNTLVNIDSQFISSFIRGKGALVDVETFAINPIDNDLEFVIGFISSRVETNLTYIVSFNSIPIFSLISSIDTNVSLISDSLLSKSLKFSGKLKFTLPILLVICDSTFQLSFLDCEYN